MKCLLLRLLGSDNAISTLFLEDEGGATAIEYGLIAALISVVVIGVLGTTGVNLNTTFTSISSNLGN